MRIVDSEGTSKLGFLRDERQDFDPFLQMFLEDSSVGTINSAAGTRKR